MTGGGSVGLPLWGFGIGADGLCTRCGHFVTGVQSARWSGVCFVDELVSGHFAIPQTNQKDEKAHFLDHCLRNLVSVSVSRSVLGSIACPYLETLLGSCAVSAYRPREEAPSLLRI